MDQYTELYTQSAAALQELDEQINQLKAEYQNVYSKRQYYYARMQTIQLQQRMNQRGNYSGQNVPGMFNKLDDQVSDLEYEAQSLRKSGEWVRMVPAYPVTCHPLHWTKSWSA